MEKEKEKIPSIKKNLKTFLLDEEGKMTKKDIAKMTAVVIATSGALSALVKAADTFASCSHGSHSNHSSGCSSVSW